MKKLRRSILKLLPDKIFTYIVFMIKLKYVPNFNEPKSLNEKLNYIKLNKTLYQLRCMVADRLKVRDYVLNKSENCNLIKNLWAGVDFTKEIWDDLPKRFVLKANHGSGMVSIVNKDQDQFSDIQKLTSEWLKQDYTSRAREWFYADLEKILIVEEFIEFENDVPPDYKFLCMNGKVTMVQVDLDRFKGHLRNLYDREFNRMDGELIYQQGYKIEKPPLYEKAIIIAEELSTEFDFIRVDLYLLDDKIYFGELTNIPESGTGKLRPRSLDFKLGEKLKLF